MDGDKAMCGRATEQVTTLTCNCAGSVHSTTAARCNHVESCCRAVAGREKIGRRHDSKGTLSELGLGNDFTVFVYDTRRKDRIGAALGGKIVVRFE
jgi:hypothetical protein